MSWQEKEAQLIKLFKLKKRPRGIISPLYEAEQQAEVANYKFDGQRTFFHCFIEFYLETLQAVSTTVVSEIPSLPRSRYVYFLLFHVDQFRIMRSAEILFSKGYAFQGYGLLRNVLEEAIFMSAIMQGITSVEKIEGIDGHAADQPIDEKKIRNNRKNEQRRVLSIMMAHKSELSLDSVDHLSKWESLFDKEIHGSRLSKTEKLDWLLGLGALHIVPVPQQSSSSMLMNRYNEMAWALIRLMPMLQAGSYEFSPSWREKWNALDDWVHHSVEALTTQLNKPVGAAFVELIEVKFPFFANTPFPITHMN